MRMLSEPQLPPPCDRCPADARVRAVLPTIGELLFCSDHLLDHLPRLRDLQVDLRQLR